MSSTAVRGAVMLGNRPRRCVCVWVGGRRSGRRVCVLRGGVHSRKTKPSGLGWVGGGVGVRAGGQVMGGRTEAGGGGLACGLAPRVYGYVGAGVRPCYLFACHPHSQHIQYRYSQSDSWQWRSSVWVEWGWGRGWGCRSSEGGEGGADASSITRGLRGGRLAADPSPVPAFAPKSSAPANRVACSRARVGGVGGRGCAAASADPLLLVDSPSARAPW